MILYEILRGLAETVRETLPSDEKEAGAWLAGLSWAFVLHWTALILVTAAHCSARGGC